MVSTETLKKLLALKEKTCSDDLKALIDILIKDAEAEIKLLVDSFGG